MNDTFISKMQILFNQDYFSDEFEPEGKVEQLAEEVLNDYTEDEIYNWFYNHLVSSCHTAQEVYNAINLYYCYSFDKIHINDLYDFLGYIFWKIDVENNWQEYGDFTDSFAIGLLERAGLVDLVVNPYYQSWHDEKIKNSIENWRTKSA